jgi:hypothetical protein
MEKCSACFFEPSIIGVIRQQVRLSQLNALPNTIDQEGF